MEVLYLSYGVPSIILTLFFLIFLNRSEFKYSFYRILQCDLIVNVFCFLNGWFSRFSKWTFTAPMMLIVYENFYFAFHLNSFGINFFYNLQSMSVIIMSLHRLSSSEFINANDFWTKYYLPIYILTVSTFVCFNLTVYLGNWTPRPLRYNEPTKVFVSVAAEGPKSVVWAQIFYWMTLTYFLVILLTNILTIISIKTRYNKKSSSEKTRRMMKNLTIITGINSSIFFIVFIWQSVGKGLMELQSYMATMYLLSDSMTLLLPYMLLVFDRNVRKALAKVIGGQAACLAKSLGNDSSLIRNTSVVQVVATNQSMKI
ncbi:hypothetical protein B9Z55_016814 [Caenorhabditis nigoni]|uniref:Serpentine receptor class gamma n=1 Tax=Caenorhabditis nigoni TaxID=1611254 RepID=A0A2G5T6P3_9PELO|nr:hypothetical protein B9Z55_016814 [Caenorhabditis nigoni]